MTEGVSLEAAKSEKLSCLMVDGTSTHATVAVCSIDGKALSSSSRMVLIYSTETANTDMELSEDRITMRKGGKLPILMLSGQLKASLKCANPDQMALYALKIDGTRNERIPVTVEKGSLIISIDTATLKDGPTPFFELVKENIK